MNVRLVVMMCLATVLWATPASARDYDRNDVSGREIGLMIARTSLQGGPFAMLVRGVARRHTRFFYVAGEVMLGTTLEPTFYGSGGVAVGIETAEDAYKVKRGYAEVGVTGQWSRSSVFELLNLHVEVGLRLQLQTTDRPHLYAYVGTRVMTSFSTYGVGLASGVGWTFD